MRVSNKNLFSTNVFFKLKNQDWLNKQRVAGKVAARTLLLLEKLVKEKTTKSLIELNNIAEEFITDNGCSATFKGYKSFPAGVCISVNQQLVHGIPNDYKLQEGDVVSFDLGATFEGAIADTAITCIYGEPKSEQHVKLITATQQALMNGISAIKISNKLGCIGNAIFKSAKNDGFSVINNYGGHGLDWDTPHAPPFVANKADINEGIRLQSHLVLAIEPMLTTGSTNTRVDKDGWTVWCDAEMSSHFEHSVYIHEDRVEIITDRDNL
jgi:methionyl aminopeptidase